MLNFRKALEAFRDIKNQIGRPINDPKIWDLALGLEAMTVELDQRLANIERTQQQILQELRRRQ